MSPLESESRMAAQFAPFETVDWIPYFLNRPFSCAITIGELSVSAMMPNFIFATSGESSADSPAAQPFGRPANSADKVSPLAARWRNSRRRRRDFVPWCICIARSFERLDFRLQGEENAEPTQRLRE